MQPGDNIYGFTATGGVHENSHSLIGKQLPRLINVGCDQSVD